MRVVSVWKPAGIARMAGEPNRFSACRKATRAPASRVGSASGTVMCRAVCQVLAPSIDDASSSSPGMRSSALATRMKT